MGPWHNRRWATPPPRTALAPTTAPAPATLTLPGAAQGAVIQFILEEIGRCVFTTCANLAPPSAQSGSRKITLVCAAGVRDLKWRLLRECKVLLPDDQAVRMVETAAHAAELLRTAVLSRPAAEAYWHGVAASICEDLLPPDAAPGTPGRGATAPG